MSFICDQVNRITRTSQAINTYNGDNLSCLLILYLVKTLEQKQQHCIINRSEKISSSLSVMWFFVYVGSCFKQYSDCKVSIMSLWWDRPPFVCVFPGCVEVLSQHLNEHFASPRMKSFCQPPLIEDD